MRLPLLLALVVAAGGLLMGAPGAAGAGPTDYGAAGRGQDMEGRLHTPAGSTEPARSGERTPPPRVKHFGGRITEIGPGHAWIEARSWFGFGGKARFVLTSESVFIRHGEERPLTEIQRGDYVGVWYVEDAQGVRNVRRVQVGGKPGSRPQA